MMPESTYTHSAEGKVLEHVVEAVEKNVDLYASLYDVWWDSCGANSNSLLVDGSSTRVHQNQLLRLNLEVQRNICNDCIYFLQHFCIFFPTHAYFLQFPLEFSFRAIQTFLPTGPFQATRPPSPPTRPTRPRAPPYPAHPAHPHPARPPPHPARPPTLPGRSATPPPPAPPIAPQ